MPAGTSYLFKEGMLSSKLNFFNEDGKEYYGFTVKNHFLHAVHPVGWIKKLDVEINGTSIDADHVFFVLRGQWFLSSKMRTINEVFWNIREEAQVFFETPRPLAPGQYQVRCAFITSMLEDTQVLDEKNAWPKRVEFVDGMLSLRGA
jgi:hypothetical protein